MKIDSSGRIRPSSRSGKGKAGKSVSSGGFADHLDVSGGTATPITPAAPTQSVDAVVALQGVDDSTSGQADARARKWGFDTLDQLEQIRIDLLVGAIPKERLVNLARMVSAHRERSNDPRLSGVLDEIELRVRVEIAKYEPRPIVNSQ